MKANVLVSGHPNIYDECLELFNNIDLDYEICSHFWWSENYQGKCYKMNFSEKCLNHNMVKTITKNLKIEKFFYEPYEEFDIKFVKKFDLNTWRGNTLNFYKIMTPILIYSLLSQITSVYKSFNLSNSNPDIIIRTRPDVLHTKSLSSILSNIDIEDNTIYFQSSMEGGHLYAGEFPQKPCDWFFIGKKKAVGDFIQSWKNSIFDFCSNGMIHTNELVQKACKKSNLEFSLVDFGAIIYKQSNDYYHKFHIDANIYLENFDYLNNKPLNKDIWPVWIDNVDFAHFSKFL